MDGTADHDIPGGRMARSARIAALPLAFGGRAIAGWGRKLVGADAAMVSAQTMERNAEQLFTVLGQLKGGAMKIGQALSVYESMIPADFAEPYRRALTKLQAAGPAMATCTVHRVLAEQFGRGWRSRFRDFDDTPAASASVGQVHHAVWRDGRDVAVKVQYPGADLALDADLRTLQRFSGLFNLVVPALDARAVLQELRERMLEELDYPGEADRQRAFAAEYADDPALRVPRVVASAPKVIVSEWLDGVVLGTVIGTPADAVEQAGRDRHAHTVLETMFSSPARLGLLHSDPHPGNFMALDDGRLGMVDFGSVAVLPDGIPPVLVEILRCVADSEEEQMMTLLRAEGFVAGDVPAEDVLSFIGALADPLRVETFHFSREWMTRQGARVADLSGRAYLDTGRALSMPAEYMLVVRVLSGWANILAQLDCTVAARGIAERRAPGFAHPAGVG